MEPAFGGSNPPAPAIPGRPARLRRLAPSALKLAVTAALLAWVLARANLAVILDALRGARLEWVLAAFALHFVGLLLSALRWRLLLRAQGAAVGHAYLGRSLLVGIFFNNFLPSTIGGDLMRARDTAAHAGSGTGSLAVVLVERTSGILVLGFFLLAAPLAGTGSGASSPLATAAAAALLLGFALFTLGMRPRPLAALLRVVRARRERSPAGRAQGLLLKAEVLLQTLGSLSGSPGTLRATFLLALLLQANVVLHYWCIGRSLDLPLAPDALLLVIPVATVLLLLPVSVNGIGAREAVFAFLLGRYGISASEALAFSWIAYGTVLAQGLLGGLLYATRREA